MHTITSRQHAIVKRCRAAAARRAHDSEILLDGVHLVRDALASGLPLSVAAATPAALATPEVADLVARLVSGGVEVMAVADAVMSAASPVRTPTGLIALARRRDPGLEAIVAAQSPLAVGIVGVQDPGNVGAIIRAADAAGATGVAVTSGSADPFGWKALRGAMGSAFRIPVAAGVTVPALLAATRARGVRVLAMVPDRRASDLFAADLTGPVLVLLGAEGPGLDAATSASADKRIQIPMAPGVDSLNVSVAAGIVLFEARRQRGPGHPGGAR